MDVKAKKIAFQGELGAYSHQACAAVFPEADVIACKTFESAIATVKRGDADLAMLPVENSTYGRVADIHYLLPESGLHIIGEHFERVHINLMGVPGATLEGMTSAKSHTVFAGPMPEIPQRTQPAAGDGCGYRRCSSRGCACQRCHPRSFGGRSGGGDLWAGGFGTPYRRQPEQHHPLFGDVTRSGDVATV